MRKRPGSAGPLGFLSVDDQNDLEAIGADDDDAAVIEQEEKITFIGRNERQTATVVYVFPTSPQTFVPPKGLPSFRALPGAQLPPVSTQVIYSAPLPEPW